VVQNCEEGLEEERHLFLAPSGVVGEECHMRAFLTISLMATYSIVLGAPKPEVRKPDEVVTYRMTEQAELKLEIFRPAGWKADDERPAIVFFFGGGWVGGSTAQFHPQATRLASRGMVAYCADYRVRSRHETSPFEAVTDAKAAVRWIWRNAGRQGVNRKKIVSAGGSAGGHLAACSGLVAGHDEVRDDEPPFIPAAMVLFNPVIDTSKKGYGYAKLKERYLELSPVEHVHDRTAPTLILIGSADTTTPVTGHKLFEARMKEKERSCRLILFPGQKHGFFNPRGDHKNYWGALAGMEQFLEDLGYIRITGR